MATITAGATGNWSAPGTWIGGIVPQPGDVARPAAFNVTIDVDITVATLEATAAGRFLVSTARTITANVVNTTGASSNGVITFSNGAGTTATLIGNITCNSPNSTAPGVVMTGVGALNITGNVVAGGVGANGYGVNNAGGGTVTLTGDVVAGAAGSSFGVYNSAGGTLVVNGNVTGSSGTSSIGANNAASGTLVVNGNATATNGNSAFGAQNGSNGTLTVTGRAVGGTNTAAIGAYNGSAGTMTVGVAVGNGYGPGGTSSFSIPGVSAANTVGNITRVYAIESGPYGQSAITGPVLMVANPATNAATFRTAYNGATLTLTDPTASADWPDAADVRLGVDYDLGDKTGTCAVPTASQVASGVAVDATTGTAVLTSQNARDAMKLAPTAGAPAAGSIDAYVDGVESAIAALNNLSQAQAEAASTAALAAYDPPTQAEMDARTLPAASYATAAGVASRAAPGDAMTLTAGALTAINGQVLAGIEAAIIEGALTLPEALRVILAFAAGPTEGADTDELIYKSQNGAVDRITMTVDDVGERSAVVLDATP